MEFNRQNTNVKSSVANSHVIDQGLRSHMLKVYNYMASGVFLTGIVSLLLFKLSGGYDIQITSSGITGLTGIGIALFAILQEINLDETYQSYGELLIKSYFYLAVFWSLADAISPVRDFVGEKYDFLTPTLRNWIFRTLNLHGR